MFTFYPGRPQDPRCEQQQPAQRQRQGPAGQDRARVQGLGLHQLHVQEVRRADTASCSHSEGYISQLLTLLRCS